MADISDKASHFAPEDIQKANRPADAINNSGASHGHILHGKHLPHETKQSQQLHKAASTVPMPKSSHKAAQQICSG